VVSRSLRPAIDLRPIAYPSLRGASSPPIWTESHPAGGRDMRLVYQTIAGIDMNLKFTIDTEPFARCIAISKRVEWDIRSSR